MCSSSSGWCAIRPDEWLYFLRLVWYADMWFGDRGARASLQVSAMAVHVPKAVYLWLRFRGLRRCGRLRLGTYLALAGVALLLMLEQQFFYRISDLEAPRLVRFPETADVPVPDPTPDGP